MDEHVIILGGGISGLTVGHEIASRGIRVTVLEASNQTGGLAGTLREGPYFLDYGPHSFFSEDVEIRDLILNLFAPPLKAVPRHSAFFFQGRYLDYPLTAASVLFQMGLGSGLKAFFSFLFNKVFSSRPRFSAKTDMTVEDWAVSNFGPYLYQTFFKPYTEQFWKIPCGQLSSSAIPSHTRTGFIRTLKLLLTRNNGGENATQVEREALPTYYPPSGYGEIADQMASLLIKENGNLKTRCCVTDVIKEDGEYFVLFTGPKGQGQVRGTHVISTLPLSVFIPMLHPRPSADILQSARSLDYRPLINLGMVIERKNVLPCTYFYTLDRPYNRLTEMNRFSPLTSPEHENIIAAEIPCLRTDPLWNASKEALFEHCIGALEQDQILTRREVKRLILAKASHAYPIYRAGYKRHLDRVMNFIHATPHLHTLGRSGEFYYRDLDQCVRRAVDLAEKLFSRENAKVEASCT